MLSRIKIGKEELKLLYTARKLGVVDKNQLAYILATVFHETAGTFKPVIESYWVRDRLIRKYGRKRGIRRFYEWLKQTLPTSKYFPYVGRGYVQLTWKDNYEKASIMLTEHYGSEYIDLVSNPSWAMIPEFAAIILIKGMIDGFFTGRKLDDYISDNRVNFIDARRIINGKDRAKRIARYAEKYKRIL